MRRHNDVEWQISISSYPLADLVGIFAPLFDLRNIRVPVAIRTHRDELVHDLAHVHLLELCQSVKDNRSWYKLPRFDISIALTLERVVDLLKLPSRKTALFGDLLNFGCCVTKCHVPALNIEVENWSHSWHVICCRSQESFAATRTTIYKLVDVRPSC